VIRRHAATVACWVHIFKRLPKNLLPGNFTICDLSDK
jgi:hypothetical protein